MTLYRSRNHKLIAGVCGGLADWLGWTPTGGPHRLRRPLDRLGGRLPRHHRLHHPLVRDSQGAAEGAGRRLRLPRAPECGMFPLAAMRQKRRRRHDPSDRPSQASAPRSSAAPPAPPRGRRWTPPSRRSRRPRARGRRSGAPSGSRSSASSPAASWPWPSAGRPSASRPRGSIPAQPGSGEEALVGPYFILRNLRLLRESLLDIQTHGRAPHPRRACAPRPRGSRWWRGSSPSTSTTAPSMPASPPTSGWSRASPRRSLPRPRPWPTTRPCARGASPWCSAPATSPRSARWTPSTSCSSRTRWWSSRPTRSTSTWGR